jgi:TnpA family transposase
MSAIQILSKCEANEFDTPPPFSAKQRQHLFALTPEVQKRLKKLRTAANKVGFLLQWGYFNAVSRFYLPLSYAKADIRFVEKLLAVNKMVDLTTEYPARTRQQHEKIILKITGHRRFAQCKKFFMNVVRRYVEKQVHPRKIFDSVIETLEHEKIEIPTYHQLENQISKTFTAFEQRLVDIIENTIARAQSKALDELTATNPGYYQRSLLTRIKMINQSLLPGKIKQSLHGFLILKRLYRELTPLIEALNLSPETAAYYGKWVIKAKMSQLDDIVDVRVRYLYLLGFIVHQYKRWDDTFIEIVFRSAQQHANKIAVVMGEINTEKLPEKNKLTTAVLEGFQFQRVSITKARSILYHDTLTEHEKIEELHSVIPPKESSHLTAITTNAGELQGKLDADAKKTDYFDVLTKLSQKYQNRVGGIIQHVEFDVSETEPAIKEALLHYQTDTITKSSPRDFPSTLEQAAVYKDDGFNSALYKALLLMRVANDIKTKKIHLLHSYRYLPVESYLVGTHYWEENKTQLLQEAGLTEFADCEAVSASLEAQLGKLYYSVNERIVMGHNVHVKLKKDGTYCVHTPAIDKPDYEPIIELVGKDKYVPILQMVAEMNVLSNFTLAFKHHKHKDAKPNPSDETFYAGLFALGSNIGLHKLGNTALGINYNTLDTAVNWYFSVENLQAVNDKLIKCMRKLWLPNQFRKEKSVLHTSGDAQKRCVSVESLYANYSFKYFGKGKGANLYTFIDERGILFYSTVFSSAERDAAYVIDGLLYNDAIKSDMHSTDTHGYSAMVFAITHFIGVQFAPRIKVVASQRLVAFKKIRRDLAKKNHPIKPSETVDVALIKRHWDSILRLLVSIKLKEHRPSTILKRLNAEENPHQLQLALQAFGKIIKSIFILKYIDDVELRQTIEKQLNKGELANSFGNAVSFANNREIMQGGSEDQEIAALCKTILQNIIILWNYSELTKLIIRTDENKRAELLAHITNGSILTWAHVNMLGTYDLRHLLSHNDAQYVTNDEVLSFQAA